MAIDRKYGRVTLEHSTIGEDEPVVVFRARDQTLPMILNYAMFLAEAEGSPLRHMQMLAKVQKQIADWQVENGSRVPTSEASRAWLDE